MVAYRAEAVAIVKTGDRGGSLASLALLQSGGGKPLGVGEGGENVAVAINAKDGTTLFETAFLITYAASGVVDQENAAIAYSNCELCRTFAAAIQVVLVPEDRARDITPTNTSIAVNEECPGCETVSFATQIILGVSGPVRLTEEGNEMMDEIWEDLEELSDEAEDLSVEEITERYDDIVSRLENILENELDPVGGRPQEPDAPGKGKGAKGGMEESTAPEESTEPTTPEDTGMEESTTPETTAPEATEPTPTEQTTPETTAPEATVPEATVPEATAPVAPEATLPDGTNPEGTSPTGAAPGAAEEPSTAPSGEAPAESTVVS